jgi:hypothetical protein
MKSKIEFSSYVVSDYAISKIRYYYSQAKYYYSQITGMQYDSYLVDMIIDMFENEFEFLSHYDIMEKDIGLLRCKD